MFSQLLVSVVFSLSIAAAASPVVVVRDNHIKLPFTRHLNLAGASLVKSDQARAQSLKTRHLRTDAKVGADRAASSASSVGIGITNGVVSYTAEVQVGSPPTTFNLLVDTGSSNTWVGADPDNPYVVTSTSEDTGQEVLVEYGSGLFFGEEFIDTITVGGLTIPQQSIGAAEISEGFSGVDGILGLGPIDLTNGTLENGDTIPTVTDNAFSLGLIDSTVLGISFEPTTQDSAANGELTFGGIDSSKFTGDINFVNITSTSPASDYVGINQTVAYGSKTILTSVGIVDTGTTLLLLASDAYDAYQTATGATLDSRNTGLLQITSAQFNKLQSLFFTIGGVTFELTPNAQLWPRALNTAIGGKANDFYLIVSNLGTPSGEGFDFVNGMTFLERFYTVFDSGESQFGIATTSFTNATTN